MKPRRPIVFSLAVQLAVCVAAGGCASLASWPLPGAAGRLLPDVPWRGGDADELERFRLRTTGEEGPRATLKPAAIQAGTVSFEVAFVERHASDPLLGDALWDEIDQIGSLDRRVRERLGRHGIRVGICGSRSPETLEKLLGSVPEIGEGPEMTRTSLRQQTLLSGGSTVFEVGQGYDPAGRNEDEAEASPVREGSGAMAMTVRASQPGWAELTFVPQLVFEQAESPYVATDEAWRFANGKRRRRYRELTFALSLGELEYAVIGFDRSAADESGPGVDDDGPVGRRLFAGDVEGEPVERLLVLRVVTAEPPEKRRR